MLNDGFMQWNRKHYTKVTDSSSGSSYYMHVYLLGTYDIAYDPVQ